MKAIYKITNIINKKFYIGKSQNALNRMVTHFSQLQRNNHFSIQLQSDFNKYGIENFTFQILEKVKVDENLNDRENYWIQITHASKNGYNISEKKNKINTKQEIELNKLKLSIVNNWKRKITSNNIINIAQKAGVESDEIYLALSGEQIPHLKTINKIEEVLNKAGV